MSASRTELDDVFVEAWEKYPLVLTGVTAAVGALAMRQFCEGSLSFSKFVDWQLSEQASWRVETVAANYHVSDAYDRPPLPDISRLVKGNIMMATYALIDDHGQASDDAEALHQDEQAQKHMLCLLDRQDQILVRLSVAQLFAAANSTLDECRGGALAIAHDYKLARMGISSPDFRDVGTSPQNANSRTLTDLLRPILKSSVRRTAERVGSFDHPGLDRFVDTVNRPGPWV